MPDPADRDAGQLQPGPGAHGQVVGLFGLALFVAQTGWGFTALSGALTLTVFNLPLLSRLTEQAIRAVPADERNGSLALGSTKWQTIRHVVLPIAGKAATA